ncbi:MAG: DMT family transporter [Robiginitomaculum sp.]|nr:DMT family transporter [Robiginitomaculum sp.]
MLAIVLILISAVFHASVNLVVKQAGDRLVNRALINLTSGIIAMPLLFFVAPLTPLAAKHLAIGIAFHWAYQMATIRAFKHGDFSAVYPVMRGTSVLLTAIGAAVLLGESFPPIKLAGLFIASLALTQFRKSASPAHRSALLWALLTAFTIGAYTVNDGAGAKAAASGISYVVWFFAIEAFPVTLTAILMRRGRFVRACRAQWRSAMIAGVMSFVGYGLSLIALRLADVSEITALRETSVVFAALMGVFILHENFGRRRIFAALALAAGLIFMQLGG